MPSKKGFCWCFGGRAPPEITYGIENGAMTLKQIEVDAPMPQDEEELNAMFAELVVSIHISVHSVFPFFCPLRERAVLKFSVGRRRYVDIMAAGGTQLRFEMPSWLMWLHSSQPLLLVFPLSFLNWAVCAPIISLLVLHQSCSLLNEID